MKTIIELPEWQYKEIIGDKGISEGVMINALCAIRLGEPTDKNFTKADIDAIVKAINAHWELIIDEIRAEIDQEKVGYPPSAGYYKAIMKVLQIIDKYKADKEQE